MEHGIIERAVGMYGYKGWPSVCKDENGILYAVCSDHRIWHICPFGRTSMYISKDEGCTWSPPIVINDSPLDDRDAGIVSMGNGKLLVTWFRHPAEVYLNQYASAIKNSCDSNEALIALAQMASYNSLAEDDRKGGSFVRVSEDSGITWSEVIRVPVSAPHGANILSDGTLIYLGKEHYSYGMEEPHVIAAYQSKDDGFTWEKLCTLLIPDGYTLNNFHEPHVIELPNGRLLGAIRAQGSPSYHGFTIFTCFSDDKGKSWSIPKSLDISGSPPHLLLHSSGAVICSYGRREAPYGERAVISLDNGETWADEYFIFDNAPDSDLGYPATVELSDSSLLTVYYQKYQPGEKCSLLYTKWNLNK